MAALASRRHDARAERDFALADSLRTRIEAAGWRVVDEPDGWRLERAGASAERFPNIVAVPSRAAEPDGHAHSICLAVHGWPEDVRRLLAACAEGAGDAVEVVAVDAIGAGLTPADLEPPGGWGGALRVIRIDAAVGHADACNVAARQATGRLLHFVEPSLELGLAVLQELAAALDDAEVGLVGPFGLSTDDMRTFHADEGEEVAALEYLLTMRRRDAARVGEFDPAFRFYRNLDIDFSHQVRAAGLRVRRVDCGPITRHAHRLWETTSEPERERLSRRNFNRFLDRWGRS